VNGLVGRWARSGSILAWLLAALSQRPIVAQQPSGAPSPQPLAVRVSVSSDTILIPPHETLPILVRLSRPARVVATLALADEPSTVVWRSDTAASGSLSWDLRGPGGVPVGSGRYAIRVTARDSAGGTATAGLAIVLTALPPDTLSPPPLPEMLPETVLAGHTEPWAIPIAVAPLVIPQYLGRSSLNSGHPADRTRLLVSVTVGVAGFVAFVTGRHLERHAENARLNASAQADYNLRLAEVEAANATARANAPLRVQLVEGVP